MFVLIASPLTLTPFDAFLPALGYVAPTLELNRLKELFFESSFTSDPFFKLAMASEMHGIP